MSNTPPDLAALIGSRICHDLISPIGAINNGLELLEMAGIADSPELSLISQSVENASARIRFFRLAFGAASEQQISAQDLRNLFADVGQGSKLSTNWQVDAPSSRADVRICLLAQQCVESAMPYGGMITIQRDGDLWHIRGMADKFQADPVLWSALADSRVPADLAPADVHFALLAQHCLAEGRRLRTDLGPQDISIRF